MRLLDYFFDDKPAATLLLVLWILVVCGTLQTLDLLHSEFMTCGPSPHTRFMTVMIDTWPKWWLLALATFFNTCVTDFMTDAIAPWLQNTMQDHKTRFLPYSKLTCYLIYQTWAVYMSVMALFSVALIMSQIDFLLIRLGADLLVNTFTAYKFMRNKTLDSRRYSAWFEEELAAHECGEEADIDGDKKKKIPSIPKNKKGGEDAQQRVFIISDENFDDDEEEGDDTRGGKCQNAATLSRV